MMNILDLVAIIMETPMIDIRVIDFKVLYVVLRLEIDDPILIITLKSLATRSPKCHLLDMA